LKYALSERLSRIRGLVDLDLEINPLKVYEQMRKESEKSNDGEIPLPLAVTSEDAARNPEVQAIIAPRMKTIMEIAASILSVLINSVDQIPYGIRWICKQIRSLAKVFIYLTQRKFPNSTEAQKCSLIGGFFMLRFINPAIITPEAYILVEGETKKNPRRTLTLVIVNIIRLPNYFKTWQISQLTKRRISWHC
jgi:Ras GTPase-activating-like protein IQGAP2/3